VPCLRCEFESARQEPEFVLAWRHPEHDRALAPQYVTAPRAPGLAFLALTLWVLGYPDQAIAVREHPFAQANHVAHENTIGFVHIYAGAELSTLLGDVNRAKLDFGRFGRRMRERFAFDARYGVEFLYYPGAAGT
jgi:hypothetical protein